jgi:hypothetical protein
MQDERDMRQPQRATGAGPAAAAPSLDINAETYPFELVQHLIDQAAVLNLYSIPAAREGGVAMYAPGGGDTVIGFRISESLRRFQIDLHEPSKGEGVRASNLIGETVGRFEQRWMIIPDGYVAVPGEEPPPTALDPSRRQRFVMLDAACRFGEGADGFRGFGTGLTFPSTYGGRRQLLAAAVGNLMEGTGKFRGREGTYTYCGTLSTEQGFRGNLLCRVADPSGALRTEAAVPAPEQGPEPEPDVTYLMFRGQKKDRTQRTGFIIGPDGQINGLNVSQQLRMFHADVTARGRVGLRASGSIGQVIGRMRARISFNLLNPGAPGTGAAPIPFMSFNEYTFLDAAGEEAGAVAADGGEGRTFNLRLEGAPGQAALRFGGFGLMQDGTGSFRGAEGLMTDNSVVGIGPHALSTLYILRVYDPEGKYRAGGRGGNR